MIKPIISDYTGEYLGEFEKIKLNFEEMKRGAINEKNK